MSEKLKIGFTCGDLNGVGLELIIRTLEDKRMLDVFQPIIYAQAKPLLHYRKMLNAMHFNFTTINDIAQAKQNTINCVSCWPDKDELLIQPGKEDSKLSTYTLKSLEKAAVDLAQGKIHALVTAPINKAAMQSSEFAFKGHTEYFAEKMHEEPLMIMIDDQLRIALVTTHISIAEVSKTISTNLIGKKIKMLIRSLQQDFGIERPKIAVLALNPHASDNGLMGNEEKEIIQPAIDAFKNHNQLVFGPYPADGFFASGQHFKFDGIVSMYHDQGLIPFKMQSAHSGINFTGGLSVIRTSPDHGTAYDIAGKGEASIDAFRNAIFLAIDIYRTRILYKDSNKNPLKRNQVSVNEDEAVDLNA